MPGKVASGAPFYNYSVPAFRAWWVACAIDAISGSDGTLDGLFFDATPKVAVRTADCVLVNGLKGESVVANLGHPGNQIIINPWWWFKRRRKRWRWRRRWW